MDVVVKSSEKKPIDVGPFDKNEATEFQLSLSSISDIIRLSGNNNENYAIPKNNYCMPGFEDCLSNTSHIICGPKVAICDTTNGSETYVNETVETKQMSVVCSSTVSNHLYVSTKISSVDIVISGTNNGNSASTLCATGKITNDGSVITNDTETGNEGSINCSETNYGLTICTDKIDAFLVTCKDKTLAASNEFPKDSCPSNIVKSENIVANTGRKEPLKIIYEIEKFFDAINSTNKDMQKKSMILLQKQNLVDEIISYIHAVQSIIRLSTSKSLFTRNIPKSRMVVYHYKPFYEAAKSFYEAGEHILEELILYRSELQADFKVWEAYRKEIMDISDEMLYDFEYCQDEKSTKVLMHGISTKICQILKSMEVVTSKREDKNENCIDLMDSVDTYIRYSSAIIVGDETLTQF